MISGFIIAGVVFIQLFILAIVICCILMSKSPRQYFKRVLLNLQPCLPGQGFKYEIAEVINRSQKCDAELILSTVLFGKTLNDKSKHDRYVKPLIKSVNKFNSLEESSRAIYRVYVAPDVPSSVFDELKQLLNVEIFKMKHPPVGYELTQCRYLPCSDDPHKYVLSIDADDELNADVFETLDKWKTSKKPFYYKKHAMSLFRPLTAGRIGFGPGSMLDMRTRLGKYNDSSFGCDELFLKAEVWPQLKKHGAYTTKEDPATGAWILLITVFIIVNVGVLALLIYKRK